jgi:CBS domain-containing protein
MKAIEIVTLDPEVISPSANLMDAANKMKSLDIGILPVCNGDRLVGMLTDRDITIRAVADGLDPRSTLVEQAMTREVIYCFEDQDIEELAALMEKNQVRRLPVVDRNKRLIGIVSLGDVAVRHREQNLAGEILEHVSEHATASS